MANSILVLSNSSDGIHTDIVIEKLLAKSAKVLRLDVDKMASGETEIDFSASDKDGVELNVNGNHVPLTGFKSVWYRRPNFFEPSVTDPVQREHSRREIESLLDGLWLTLGNTFWLNHPLSLERARRKICQLKLAHEIGFNIPSTLVTNRPSSMEGFYKQQSQKIIYKTMGGEFLDYGDRFFNIPTTLVTPAHIQFSHLLKQTPGMFQERVEKKYELRVTIVGENIFAVKIFSQENELASVDWRHPEAILKLKYEQTILPDSVLEKCRQMMKSLSLSFGAIDLCVDSAGEYVFFEINSNPQWYWIEELSGALISDAIADILLLGNWSHP